VRPISPDRKIPPGFEHFIKSVTRTLRLKKTGKTFQKTSTARWLRGPCHTCGKVFERPLKKFDSTGAPAYCGYDCMYKRESADRPTRDRPKFVSKVKLNLKVARIIKTNMQISCGRCGEVQPVGSVCVHDNDRSWCWECYDALIQSEHGSA
jgi:hypothetical protein